MSKVANKKKPRRGVPLRAYAVLAALGLFAALGAFLLGRGCPSEVSQNKPHDSPQEVPAPRRITEESAPGRRQSPSIPVLGGPRPNASNPPPTQQLPPPPPPLTKEEAWAIKDANRLAKSEEILLRRGPKTHFDNEFENTLELVSLPNATFFAPPVIDLDEAEILEYLRKPVVISPEDSEADVAAKERTAEFKQKALEFIEAGGTVNQFVRDTLAANAERKNMMDEINQEKRRILLNEGEEAAQAYVEEMNAHLREEGLPEIKIGRGDRIALERQRRQEAEAAAQSR